MRVSPSSCHYLVISVTQLGLRGPRTCKRLMHMLKTEHKNSCSEIKHIYEWFHRVSWTLQLLGISADCICINKRIVLLTSISWALHGRERWRHEKSGWKVGCWRKIRDWRKSVWLFQQLQNLPRSQKGELKWAACHSWASIAHKGQPGHRKVRAQPNAKSCGLFLQNNHR